MDTFDLNGLEPEQAREIVTHVLRSLAETRAQRVRLENDLELWRNRVSLAARNDRADLEAEARTRVDDFELRLGSLRAEEAELVRGVDRMKRQLSDMENQPRLSVDADRLLAELELLGGERDELEEKFREEEAEALLDQLKRDMQNEQS